MSSVFRNCGVPLCPVKGVILARRLYSDVAQRPLSDVDLLIRRKDRQVIRREIERLRWRLVRDSEELGELEFVIGGFTAPRGSREHIGSLLLGAFRGRDLYFVGKVGTGFSRETLTALAKAFRPLIRDGSPFVNPPRGTDLTWLEPRLVAQIAFEEWTANRKLRQPVFLGLREDKRPSECLLPKDL